MTLRDSTAIGNGTACGVTDECADLAAAQRPRVVGTSTCGTSRNTDLGGTWRVCAGD